LNKTIRLLGEDWKRTRWIDAAERLSMLADGQADIVYRDEAGHMTLEKTRRTDGTIRVRVYAPEECAGLGSNKDSPTGLTLGDIMRNAAGAVDTPKRRLIYRMREKGEAVSASIRCYGHDSKDKPRQDLVGNAVDRSMSRVEQWPGASENNRSVTVTPGGIVGLTVIPCLA
jgi:hypothetical protein